MNLFARILIIAIAVYIGQMFFPWWIIVIVPLVVEAIFGRGKGTAFFSGFYGIAIPWMLLSAYVDIQSESILSSKILALFKMPEYGFVMIILTGLLGGLYGGLASLVGGWIRKAVVGNE